MLWWDDVPGLTPHGFCLTWAPGLIELHAAADAATFLAYFSIPISLLMLARGRIIGLHPWMFWLFSAFIFACGAAHAMAIVTLWWPFYVTEGLVKAVMAALSIATAAVMWPIVPHLLAMPSRGDIEVLNAELRRRVAEHEETNARLSANEQMLRATQDELARKIKEDSHRLMMADEQQRALFENSPDALYVIGVDREGAEPRFIMEAINPVIHRMFERKAHAFIGGEVDQFLEPAEAAELVTHFKRCIEENAVITFNSRRTADLRDYELETSLAPVVDPRTGRVTRIVGVARDVTERVALERQMLHMQKVEITGRLTAGVAHDFNNILQALMGGLEELIDTLDGRELAFAQLALRAAERGGELTHRLLAFCRQQALQQTVVDLGEILSAVRSLLGVSLTPLVSVEMVLPDPPIAALVDAAQLEAALLNLLVNAGDAMPGRGLITLSAAAARKPDDMELPDGDWGVIAVTDTGVGMDETVRSQACDPFFTTKGPRGSGLGLSMVQGFARQSGGEMRIESAPGRGTRVELWLPLVPNRSVEPALSQAPTVEGAGHILLVDDDADIRIGVGAFLRGAGFTVTSVSSGEEALACIRSGLDMDALVTDQAMPNMTGSNLVRSARKLLPDLHALIITGFADTKECDCSAVSVLRKPFSRDKLLVEVERVVKQGAAQRRVLL